MIHRVIDLSLYPELDECLSGDDRRVAFYSLRLHDRTSLVSACYLLTIFQYLFFKNELDIITEPVIGWVNDGTDEQMISHAWLEFHGAKVDISLDRTEYPEILRPGSLMVLDYMVAKGHPYTYHRQRSQAARKHAQQLARTSAEAADIVALKEREHASVLSISKDDSRMRAWLEAAPPDRTYEALRRLVLD